MTEKPQMPKMTKIDTFWLIKFDPSIVFLLKLGRNVEVIVPNIKPLPQTLAKLWFTSLGDF